MAPVPAGSRRGLSSPARRRPAFEDGRERSDRLRHAVLEHLEIRLLSDRDGLPALVANDDVDENRA